MPGPTPFHLEDDEKTLVMKFPPAGTRDTEPPCETPREAGLSPAAPMSVLARRRAIAQPAAYSRWWQRWPFTWIAMLFQRPPLASAPVPARGRILDRVAPLLWDGTPSELAAVTDVLARIRVAQMRGHAVFLEERIAFFLERIQPSADGTIALSSLRTLAPGESREDVDRALLHLEAMGRIDLLPPAAPASGVGIDHPTRGPLDRCALVAPKRWEVVS